MVYLNYKKSITELIQEHNEAQNDGRILELQQNDQWNITYIYIFQRKLSDIHIFCQQKPAVFLLSLNIRSLAPDLKL